MLRRGGILMLALVMAGCVPRGIGDPVVPVAVSESVVPPETVAAGEARHLIQVEGRYGYVDRSGEVVIEPRFSDAGPFVEGLARVLESGRWGFIRPDGSPAISPRFASAADFAHGRARVVTEEAGTDLGSRQARPEDRSFQTYITPAGDAVVEPVLLEARDFAAVGDRTLAPAVRANVRRLVPLGADFLGFLAPVLQTREHWIVLDRHGNVVSTLDAADRMLGFAEGLAAFRQRSGWLRARGRWGYADASGAVVIEPRFEYAGSFSEGLAPVALGGRYGFVDRTGRVEISPDFEYAGPFREGRARVRVDGAWGFVDRSGVLVIEPRYASAADFAEGTALVSRDDRFGFIRPDGSATLPLEFDYARPFRNGLAYVRIGDREGYIDQKGEFIWERHD